MDKAIKITLASTLLLSGCGGILNLHSKQELAPQQVTHHIRPYVNNPHYRFQNAILPGKVTYESLNCNGITVIEHGDELHLVMPTDYFFDPDSNTIKNDKSHVFNLIFKMLKNINSPIIITGHSDGIGHEKDQIIKTKKMAEELKSYFWMLGIPQKQIMTIGAGSKYPISDHNVRGNALNRRIVISVRNY